MKATWHGQVIAESNQTIELDGCHHFPPASVRTEFLQWAPKTEADHRCPHRVQYFNLTDGSHRSERAACTWLSIECRIKVDYSANEGVPLS
jgi:uncharacterized protein (DUF427 family)